MILLMNSIVGVPCGVYRVHIMLLFNENLNFCDVKMSFY